ncbi:MAG TPA: hypothetical protein VMQ50_10890 [Casimicrobiaceae bacterium]|nr:hypothetical protein [Casimicrobiaceae bacterium]
MPDKNDDVLGALWMKDLDELDLEIARMALLCQVKVLEPGIIERVWKKDASVCGTDNPLAFEKLHNLLMMHFKMREKLVDAVGQAQTAQIEADVIERLRKPFGDLVGKWPPA